MPIRGAFLQPGTVTKTLVCIDSIEPADFSGRFYNPYLRDCVPFYGVFDLMCQMDQMLDQLGFPYTAFRYRYFYKTRPERIFRREAAEPVRFHEESMFSLEKGKVMTVIIQVKTRRNATWQGSAYWVEQSCRVYFESACDFIRLISGSIFSMRKGTGLLEWRESAPE